MARHRPHARIDSVRGAAALALLGLLAACGGGQRDGDTRYLELDAPALATELAAGRVTAERITHAVLARIAAIDRSGPALRSIIEVNPDALEIARDLDRRFAARGPVGVLHGVPVVLKANIDTADRMATSAGSLALRQHHAQRDAAIVERLRAAGAVIVAKSNLSEWANFRSPRSTSGWSSLGGQTRNPYVLDRNPCGSSSGSAVAVAARIVPLAVGTETDGSIVCPAGVNGVVGLKPERGSVTGTGIVPISGAQDTPGPLARTVAGAALLLGVLQGDATTSAPVAAPTDLGGMRLGVIRDYLGAEQPDVGRVYSRALELLAGTGAELVDPLALGLPATAGRYERELLLEEFHNDVDAYLAAAARSSAAALPGSLAAVIDFNRANAELTMPYFGQEWLERALTIEPLAPALRAAAIAGSRGAARQRLDALLETQTLDVLVAPTNGPAWPIDYVRGDVVSVASGSAAALAGYPSITVPAGMIDGLPIGLTFIGRPGAQQRLVAIAAAFERARGAFAAPAFRSRGGR